MIVRILFIIFFLFVWSVYPKTAHITSNEKKSNTMAVPIYTPDIEEGNELAINPPAGWGYRTFRGKNGLLGVLWPLNTTFSLTQISMFIFIQNNNESIPKIPDNINLFREKCTKAKFHFSNKDRDVTDSIHETYFSGRCGKTMILLEDSIDDYQIIIALTSGTTAKKEDLTSAKKVLKSYRKEIKKYLDAATQNDGSKDNIDNMDRNTSQESYDAQQNS